MGVSCRERQLRAITCIIENLAHKNDSTVSANPHKIDRPAVSQGATLTIRRRRALFQVHSLDVDEAVAEHVYGGTCLFEGDIADERFVLAVFIGFHVQEQHLRGDRPELPNPHSQWTAISTSTSPSCSTPPRLSRQALGNVMYAEPVSTSALTASVLLGSVKFVSLTCVTMRPM